MIIHRLQSSNRLNGAKQINSQKILMFLDHQTCDCTNQFEEHVIKTILSTQTVKNEEGCSAYFGFKLRRTFELHFRHDRNSRAACAHNIC